MSRISFLILFVFSLFISSCSSSSTDSASPSADSCPSPSDSLQSATVEEIPRLDKQLDGTWTATLMDTTYIDGVKYCTKTIDVTTYDSSTHRFKTTIDGYYTSPQYFHDYTVSFSGEWSTGKHVIRDLADLNSVEFTFHSDFSDKETNEGFKAQFLKGMREEVISEIKDLSKDTLRVLDEEREYIYIRK